MKRIVVVGNGIAGISAAYTIRRHEKEAKITIVSEEPHPAYSACLLPHYVSGDIGRAGVFIKAFPDYFRNDFQLILSEKATALDGERKSVVLKSGTIAYDRLIIATGSKPNKPPIKGLDKRGVFAFKSIEDADNITGWKGHAAVVIGSGPIGAEASLALKKRGYQVFLIELLDRILPQVFDPYSSSLIETALRENGIAVTTQESAVEISGQGGVEGVITERRKIKCDTVILATGMIPEKDLAEGILEQGKLGGIRVNHRMETSLRHVYAAGDCAEAESLIDGRPALSLLWHNARRQGETAGSNAIGIPRAYSGSVNVTGVEVCGLKAVSIGSTGDGLGDGLEIVETKKEGRYLRLVLLNDGLIGAQSINWEDPPGVLLGAVLRKEKWKRCKGLTAANRLLLKRLRRFPFGRKVNQFAVEAGVRNHADSAL